MFPHNSKISRDDDSATTGRMASAARRAATAGAAAVVAAALAAGTAGVASADTGRPASVSASTQGASTSAGAEVLVRTENVVVKRMHEEKRQGVWTLNAYADLVEVRNVRTHHVIRAYLETTVVARSGSFFGFPGHASFWLGPDYFRTPTWFTGAGPFATNVYRHTVPVPVRVAERDAKRDGVIHAVLSFH